MGSITISCVQCVKVQFEIGHEASVRSEVTAQGFTHDWQVFVRGADNTEIHHFVEKVVFNLHSSFPKPKRVVKEPPYEVRESGYASFAFPIEVYLKNKDEPRKLDFMYDLSLNPSGPIRTSQREKRIFNNPSEEFRRKLIRGGGLRRFYGADNDVTFGVGLTRHQAHR
ncbi:Protein AF-9 [Homalodisca vitripennis]|nr:Protein AF-9 [Homalodisca vitripennis]